MSSIQKRGSAYRVIVSNGYDAFGKQIIRTATFKPDPNRTERQNQRALQDFAYEFEKKVKKGELGDKENITLSSFINTWIRDYASVHLRENTLSAYQADIDRFIVPVLGNYTMGMITPLVLNGFYHQMLHTPKQNSDGCLSASTVRHIHAVLCSIFTSAVKWQVCKANPCLLADPPRVEHVVDSGNFFSLEQVSRFLDYLDTPITKNIRGRTIIDSTTGNSKIAASYQRKEYPISETMKVFLYMAIFLGIRRGENIAIRWSDIDFERHTVMITKDTVRAGSKIIQNTTKNQSSIRTLSIPEHLLEMLAAHKAQQAERMKSSSWIGPKGEDAWVFTQKNGMQVYPTSPYTAFKRAVRRFNETVANQAEQLPDTEDFPDLSSLPEITLQGLRHTNVTLMLKNNVDLKTVSAHVGHTRTSTTVNIYGHVIRNNDHVVADVFEKFLSQRDSEQHQTVKSG